jgi:hypothetical protein
MATPFEDNFDAYSLGAVNGQGDWVSDGAVVSDDYFNSTPYSLEVPSLKTASKAGTRLASGEFYFWLYYPTLPTNKKFGITFKDNDGTLAGGIYVCEGYGLGDFVMSSYPSGSSFDSITANEWHLIGVRWADNNLQYSVDRRQWRGDTDITGKQIARLVPISYVNTTYSFYIDTIHATEVSTMPLVENFEEYTVNDDINSLGNGWNGWYGTILDDHPHSGDNCLCMNDRGMTTDDYFYAQNYDFLVAPDGIQYFEIMPWQTGFATAGNMVLQMGGGNVGMYLYFIDNGTSIDIKLGDDIEPLGDLITTIPRNAYTKLGVQWAVATGYLRLSFDGGLNWGDWFEAYDGAGTFTGINNFVFYGWWDGVSEDLQNQYYIDDLSAGGGGETTAYGTIAGLVDCEVFSYVATLGGMCQFENHYDSADDCLAGISALEKETQKTIACNSSLETEKENTVAGITEAQYEDNDTLSGISDLEATVFATLGGISSFEGFEFGIVAGFTLFESENNLDTLASDTLIEGLDLDTIAGKTILEKETQNCCAGIADCYASDIDTLGGISTFETILQAKTVACTCELERRIENTVAGFSFLEEVIGDTVAGLSILEKRTENTLAGKIALEESIGETLAGISLLEERTQATLAGKASLEEWGGNTVAGLADLRYRFTIVQFAGVDINNVVQITERFVHDSAPNRNVKSYKIARRDGEKLVSSYFAKKEISVTGFIQSTSRASLETLIDTFKSQLQAVGNLDIEYASGMRRYYAVFAELVIQREPDNIDWTPFSIKFIVPSGKGTDIDEIVSTTNGITAGSQSGYFVNIGSSEALPKFKFTVNAATAITVFQITSGGKAITIYDTISAGDIIIVDFDTFDVTINGYPADYTGSWPKWEPGSNWYSIALFGTSRSYDLEISYYPQYL